MNLNARVASLEAQLAELLEMTRDILSRLSDENEVQFSEFCEVGEGCKIDPSVKFFASKHDRRIRIGRGTIIRRGGEWNGPISVGKYCGFNRDSYIRANVVIGNSVNVGAFVRFITDRHELNSSGRRAGSQSNPPISVGDGTWIGACSTILGGVTIGPGAVVAAGSLVNKDVAPNTLVGGVPAKFIRKLPS